MIIFESLCCIQHYNLKEAVINVCPVKMIHTKGACLEDVTIAVP